MLRCAAERFDCLAMVKPQFEVGRERVGKGGVVRDPADRRAALVRGRAGRAARRAVLGFAPSGLPGPKGNRETFVWLAEPGARAERVGDVGRRALAEVERVTPQRDRPHAPRPSETADALRRADRGGARGGRDAALRRGGDAQARLAAGGRAS